MEKHETTCDGCGKDLTITCNYVDYRIVLFSQSIPSWDGVVTDFNIENPLPQNKHFCGMRCLLGWACKAAYGQAGAPENVKQLLAAQAVDPFPGDNQGPWGQQGS